MGEAFGGTSQLCVDGTDRGNYQAAGCLHLPRILHRDHVLGDDVFLDSGCGKGRVVVMVARYPFRRVIFVELSERLRATAQANVAAGRARRCGDVEPLCGDVVGYRIGEYVTVASMFNSFGGAVLDAAIGHLIESVDRRPRRVRLMYRNPVHYDRLLNTGRVELARRALAPRRTASWVERCRFRCT